MSSTGQEQKIERDEISLWLEGRKEAGRKIDPNCVGRSYFARSPDSGGWVSFDDLPDQTSDELWRRINLGELVDIFEARFLDCLTES